MGFASDGASAMVGKRAGAATLLAQDNPYLIKIHCVTHRANLGANAACSSVELTKETDMVLSQMSGYLCKSPLRKAELRLLQDSMRGELGDDRLPDIQGYICIRFLSRGTAVASLVKNYPVLLSFLRAQGGQCAVQAANARLAKDEGALEVRANTCRKKVEALKVEALEAAKEPVGPPTSAGLSSLEPSPIIDETGSGAASVQLNPVTQKIHDEISLLQQEETSLRQKISASRRQHQVAMPGEAKGVEFAACLLERMSSFRMMGILYVLKDFLAILNELNKMFQFRLLTYSGVKAELERARRRLKLQFLGDKGVKAYEYKTLLSHLGGEQGEAGVRARLLEEPDGFEVQYKNINEKVRINQADVNEVEGAARSLAENALGELDKRFEDVDILEQCSIFDPQLFPTDEDLMCDYRSDEIVELGKHFGKKYDGFPLCVDPDRLGREWFHAKPIMYDVRREAIMSNRISSLATAKTAAAKASAGEDEEGNNEHEPEVDRAVGRALKKGEKQRQALSETFVRLYAGFWSAVQSSIGGSHFPNLYKVVKIYIVQPHSSIECERGFSAQNRIKTPSRGILSVARLELLMRLSLSYRKQGVDLTKRIDILREAAVFFYDALARRK